MARNFGQIQTDVKRNCIDNPVGFATRVPEWINTAVRRAQRKYNFRLAEALLEPTTTLATRLLVAKPSTWKEARADPWMLRADGTDDLIRWLPSETEAKVQYSDQTEDDGEPEQLLETPTGIWIYPLPDGASDYSGGEYRIKIPYWSYLDEMSGDSDTNWFTENAADYLEFYATARGMLYNVDTAGQAATWITLANEALQDVITVDKLSMQPRRITMTPRSDVLGPTNQNWRRLL